MAWQIGGLVGFWINYGLAETMAPSHEQWIIPFAVQLVPAGMLFVGIFFIKESPRWLFSKGRREEGIKNLCWLRQIDVDHVYMQEEIFAIDNAVEEQRATVGLGFWQPFRTVINDRKTTYRFLLGGSLFLWQNATGKLLEVKRPLQHMANSTSRYQRHQLLFAYRLPIDRNHWYQHFTFDHRHLWCYQDCHHPLLALHPHR